MADENDKNRVGTVITLIWFLVVLCMVAVLLTMPRKAWAHEWFTGARNPVTKLPCCNETDCHVIPISDFYQDGADFVVIWGGKEWRIPQDQALPTQDQKGRPAACVWGGKVQCFFYPLMG